MSLAASTRLRGIALAAIIIASALLAACGTSSDSPAPANQVTTTAVAGTGGDGTSTTPPESDKSGDPGANTDHPPKSEDENKN